MREQGKQKEQMSEFESISDKVEFCLPSPLQTEELSEQQAGHVVAQIEAWCGDIRERLLESKTEIRAISVDGNPAHYRLVRSNAIGEPEVIEEGLVSYETRNQGVNLFHDIVDVLTQSRGAGQIALIRLQEWAGIRQSIDYLASIISKESQRVLLDVDIADQALRDLLFSVIIIEYRPFVESLVQQVYIRQEVAPSVVEKQFYALEKLARGLPLSWKNPSPDNDAYPSSVVIQTMLNALSS